MRQMMLRLWKDDCGALISAEWIIVAGILVIGVIVGLTSVRNAVNAELTEFGNALTGLCLNFSFAGQSNTCTGAFTCGGLATGDVGGHMNVVGVPSLIVNNIEVSPCQ